MLPLTILLAAPPAVAAEAACPAAPDAVDRALSEAEYAYSGMDETGFFAAVDRAKTLLGCVDRALPPSVAARYHRVSGIAAWARKDRDQAVLAFGAARATDPVYLFPPGLVPPGNVLMTMYGELDTSTVTFSHLPAPASGVIYFDGKATLDRPANVPTVAQVQNGQGQMVQSVWLLPADPMVPYEARSKDRHTGRRIAGAIAAVAGAGLAGWGVSSFLAAEKGEDAYLDRLGTEDADTYRRDQVIPMQRAGLVLIGLGGIGLGAGGALLFLDTTGAAVTFRW